MRQNDPRPSREIPHDLLFGLRTAIAGVLGTRSDLAPVWDATVDAFLRWLNGLPAEVTPLVRNLELLRRLEEAFNEPTLKENPTIAGIILSSAIKSGGQVSIRGQSWKVLNCIISPRFGVDYTLTNEKGELLRHEFFD